MAPIAFRFFQSATNIPEEYSGDALVAWHGSWNATKPVGFKVQRIVFENGVAVKAKDFLKGFLVDKKARFGRPAGIVISQNNTVYISDDANGVIYVMTRTQ